MLKLEQKLPAHVVSLRGAKAYFTLLHQTFTLWRALQRDFSLAVFRLRNALISNGKVMSIKIFSLPR